MLAPTEKRSLDMSEAEIASSKGTGWFVFEGQSAKEVNKAYDAMSDDELRELLKGKGVVADGRWGRDKLLSEAKKAVSA